MKAVAEVVGIAILAGLILTIYDGAVVGDYRWQSFKLLAYSIGVGCLLFLFPYLVIITANFLIRLFVKDKWTALRAHRFALVVSTVIAAVLLWGGYYGATHRFG